MGATGYTEKQAKDLKVGDELLTRYYDSTGAYQERDDKVLGVKVYTRRVRLTFHWGTYSYPATRTFGVKGA